MFISTSSASRTRAYCSRPRLRSTSPLTPHWLQYTGTRCAWRRASGTDASVLRSQRASTETLWSAAPQYFPHQVSNTSLQS